MYKLMISTAVLTVSLLLNSGISAQTDTVSENSSATAQPAVVIGNGLNQLDAFTRGLSSFSADFNQQVYDPQGRLEETSSGVLHLRQPNLLHWKYIQPFPQLIVADGAQVWSYDIELEQITVREQSDAQAQSPLTLLTDPDRLYQSFTLRNLGIRDDMAWLEMLPRDDRSNESGISSSDFARILVAMQDGELKSMALEDTLGQSTEIQFLQGQRNIELDDELFSFTPPEGIDVLEG